MQKATMTDNLAYLTPPAAAPYTSLEPTLFHEPWWLDIATGGRYSVVEYSEKGKVIGRLPYFCYKKFGMNVISLPPLTHFLGPALIEGGGKESTKFLKRLEIATALIKKLPATASCYIKCHRDITETIAFQSAGFKISVQYTNELHPQSVDVLWDNMRPNARNNIRAAEEKYTAVDGTDAEAFMAFYEQNIEGKGKNNHMNNQTNARLITAAIARGQGRILQARDKEDGTLVASIFVAWDKVAAYYLLTTHRPDAHRGATKLLVWEAIQDAMKRGLIFDFDGVSSEGCAKSANDFTALFTPRYIMIRESGPMRILRAVQSLFADKNNYF
jgi:hypothetical protein